MQDPRTRARALAWALLVPFAAAAPAAVPLWAAPAAAVRPFAPPALPEGLAVDGAGTVYVGIATTGEVRRIGPDGATTTVATLRPGLGSLLGLAIGPQGEVLAALASQDTPGADRHGIWKIAPDGATSLLATLPPATMPNGLAVAPDGAVYVTDSARGAVWRVGPDGQARRWVQDELLEGDLQACPPPALTGPVGANGLVYEAPGPAGGAGGAGALVVANTTKAQIVRIPIAPGGDAGRPQLVYGPDCQGLAGADGLAADGAGHLYVALNWQDRVVRLGPDGEPAVVATRADGLDFPASLVVRGGELYLTNYAQLTFLRDASPKPSLMTLEVR